MVDFNSLIQTADTAVMASLGDKTVTIKRGASVLASDVKAMFEKDLQEFDSNGMVLGFRSGFTVNKTELSVKTLEEGDSIHDGPRNWRVLRVQSEDQTFITVLVG